MAIVTKKAYEVTFHLDQSWYDQFQTWLEYAEVEPEEVCAFVEDKDITVKMDTETGELISWKYVEEAK